MSASARKKRNGKLKLNVAEKFSENNERDYRTTLEFFLIVFHSL